MRRLVENLRHVIRIEVERVLRLQLQPRLGNVIAYDNSGQQHAARVLLQPEGIETGWIPVHSHFVGNGYGEVVPLTLGQQVKVGFPEYGSNQGVVESQVYDARNQIPVAAKDAQAGEWIRVSGTGSLVAATNDGVIRINGSAQNQFMASKSSIVQDQHGNITLTDATGNKVAMAPNGVTVSTTGGSMLLDQQGNLHVSGNIYWNTATTATDAAGHQHSNVQNGLSVTGAPVAGT
jgi:uncharacterized protein involved in type VI secretion and phage assembly